MNGDLFYTFLKAHTQTHTHTHKHIHSHTHINFGVWYRQQIATQVTEISKETTETTENKERNGQSKISLAVPPDELLEFNDSNK